MNGATAADFYERFVVEEIPNIYAESPRRAVHAGSFGHRKLKGRRY